MQYMNAKKRNNAIMARKELGAASDSLNRTSYLTGTYTRFFGVNQINR